MQVQRALLPCRREGLSSSSPAAAASAVALHSDCFALNQLKKATDSSYLLLLKQQTSAACHHGEEEQGKAQT